MKHGQALKYINDRLLAGKTKAQIFEELHSKLKLKGDQISYLAEVPDISTRKKYRRHNIILFVLLVLMAVAKFIIGAVVLLKFEEAFLPWFILQGFWTYIFSPFALAYFAIFVFRFRGPVYRFLVLMIISYLLISLADSRDIFSWLIWHAPALFALFLAYSIGKNVFPYYGFWGNLKSKSFENDLNQSLLRSNDE